jgi:hypothetical protein
MENKKNLRVMIAVLVGVILVSVLVGFKVYSTRTSNIKNPVKVEETVESKDEFSYQGQKGVDALTILKSKTAVKLDKTGMVMSINGRNVDGAKREFWGFYVNDIMASVGAADYKTADTDVIKWKIETY